MILKNGCVEVIMYTDGMEFVLDRLFDGSVINFRQIIIEDYSQVFMRAKTNVQMLILSIDKINNFAIENEEFEQIWKTI